ncbi:MAG TPA: hypothetical protein VI876_10990 [Dehalococcoidia bacterium]|nr:hypothetical protein [Dehalococcoidia bacterium]
MGRFLKAVFWCSALSTVIVGVFAGVGVVLTKSWADATECEPATKCQQQPFDSRLWKAYGTWTDPVRLKMIEDLSASYGLRGKPRSWIDEQLGTPENNNPFTVECEYVYWLGPSQALIATEFVYLCLDFEAETVVDAKLVTD